MTFQANQKFTSARREFKKFQLKAAFRPNDLGVTDVNSRTRATRTRHAELIRAADSQCEQMADVRLGAQRVNLQSLCVG